MPRPLSMLDSRYGAVPRDVERAGTRRVRIGTRDRADAEAMQRTQEVPGQHGDSGPILVVLPVVVDDSLETRERFLCAVHAT